MRLLKGTGIMVKTETDLYRRRLCVLRDRLNGDRSQLKDEALQPTGGEASGLLSDVPIHMADLASHQFEEELTLDLLRNEDQILEEIDDALVRLDEGTFGRCENCKQMISKQRLQVVPYTRYCIECARQAPDAAK
jgi:RNA polymerase-binding transcription factor DksA